MIPKNISEAGRREKVAAELERIYPQAKCALHFDGPFQLLVATILSAQCTDKRVNIVTPVLFAKFGTAEKMARASLNEIEKIIHSTGFYHNKAKNISAAAKMLTEKFHEKVPQNMEEMIELPGVARKTANVVLSVACGVLEGIAVDTHVIRLSQRLGLTSEKTPEKIERDLMDMIPRKKWGMFSLQLIQHGRLVCIARSPLCGECTLNTICPSAFTFGKKIPQKGQANGRSDTLGVKLHAKKR